MFTVQDDSEIMNKILKSYKANLNCDVLNTEITVISVGDIITWMNLELN